ncbi:MAG: hypothetical protein K0R45_3298, partial [Pseudomonas sp.]|nr:hypothetical protein [Pseudomonas sp.]
MVAPSENGGLARQVDQILQLFGDYFYGFRHDPVGFRLGCSGCGRRRCRRYRHGPRLCGDGRHRRQVEAGKFADTVDQQRRVGQRLFVAHGIEHIGQHVMAALQQAHQHRTWTHRAARQAFVQRFQLMGEIADRRNLHHPRAAFQGMQVAQQVFDLQQVLRVGLPARQRG